MIYSAATLSPYRLITLLFLSFPISVISRILLNVGFYQLTGKIQVNPLPTVYFSFENNEMYPKKQQADPYSESSSRYFCNWNNRVLTHKSIAMENAP